jgi:hypothetical protein
MKLAHLNAWDAATTAVRCLGTLADLLRYAGNDFAIRPAELGDLVALVHHEIEDAMDRVEALERHAENSTPTV